MNKVIIYFIVFLGVIFSASANPFGLDDPTVINSTLNTCTTDKNNFRITTHNCLNEDIDGKNIEQLIDFKWNGGSSLTADFIFVYEQPLDSGNVYLLQNVTRQETFYNVSTIFNETNQTNQTVYTPYNISTVSEEYVDITNKFDLLGTNLFGHGFRYYIVDNVSFSPSQQYSTKFVYTPENASKQGKFHIFGKPSSKTINQAVSQDLFIYQDPWWNSSWASKVQFNVSTSKNSTNNIIKLTLNSSIIAYADTDGTDIRILNSDEDSELNYNRSLWNESGDSILYAQVNLTAGDSNTFYVYYNNDGATDTSTALGYLEDDILIDTPFTTGDGNDISGNSNNGTLNGNVVYNASGAYFDGGDDWITYPDLTGTIDYKTETVSFYANGASSTNAVEYLWVDTGNADTNHVFDYHASFPDRDDGTASRIKAGTVYRSGTTDYRDDTWHNFVIVMGASTYDLYVDGAVVASSQSIGSSSSDSEQMRLGATGGGTFDFTGDMKDFRYWTRTLTADEVEVNYENPVLYSGSTYNTSFGSIQSEFTIQNTTYSILDITNGLQNISVDFDVMNPENFNLTYCQSDVGGQLKNGTLTGNSCQINFSTALNGTEQLATLNVYTNGSDTASLGDQPLLNISIFHSDINQSRTHNLYDQYVLNNYTITNPLGSNGTNINWSLNSSDSIQIVNLTSSTNLTKEVTDSFFTLESTYTVLGSAFTINTAYNVYKSFNYSNDLGYDLAAINISFEIPSYSANADMDYWNTSDWVNSTASHSSGNITFQVESINTTDLFEYKWNYDATVVIVNISAATSVTEGDEDHYSFDPVINYTTEFGGSLTQSATYSHSIATATYLDNWNSKNNWGTNMSNSTGGNQSHTATDNSNFLDIDWTKANFNNATLQVDYYTDVAEEGGGGGGGGGSSSSTTIINQLSAAGKLIEVNNVKQLSYYILVVPGEHDRSLTLEAVDSPIEGVKPTFQGDIKPYVTHCFVKSNSSTCSEEVNLKEGEKGFLFVTINSDESLTESISGSMKLETEESILDIPILVDVHGQVDNIINLANSIQEDPNTATWLKTTYLIEVVGTFVAGILLLG